MNNNELKENYLTNELCDELYEMCAKSSDVPESFLKPEFKNTDSVVVETNKWFSAFSDFVSIFSDLVVDKTIERIEVEICPKLKEFNNVVRRYKNKELPEYVIQYIDSRIKLELATRKFKTHKIKEKFINKKIYQAYMEYINI